MIAVLFEVVPHKGRQSDYFNLAADLQAPLNEVAGFVSVERFTSLASPGKFLSLSFWEDEEAVRRWRTCALHRKAQAVGRETIFERYRIRVASVLRDYDMFDRDQAPRSG